MPTLSLNKLHELHRKLDAGRYILQNGRDFRLRTLDDLKAFTVLVEAEIARRLDAPGQALDVGHPPGDDLTAIDGIGPRIASALIEGGITTYAQLATTSVQALRDIMSDNEVRLRINNYIDQWPSQAKELYDEDHPRL